MTPDTFDCAEILVTAIRLITANNNIFLFIPLSYKISGCKGMKSVKDNLI